MSFIKAIMGRIIKAVLDRDRQRREFQARFEAWKLSLRGRKLLYSYQTMMAMKAKSNNGNDDAKGNDDDDTDDSDDCP